jgi:two-component system repressor protein LuxO
VLFDGPELPLRALPAVPPCRAARLRNAGGARHALTRPRRHACPARTADILRQALAMTLDEIERIAVEGAIDTAQGSLPGAARILGVSPSTLYRKRERWEDARAIGQAAG